MKDFFTAMNTLKIYPQIKSNHQKLAYCVLPLIELISLMQVLALCHSQKLKHFIKNCPVKLVIIVIVKILRMVSKHYSLACPVIHKKSFLYLIKAIGGIWHRLSSVAHTPRPQGHCQDGDFKCCLENICFI